MPYVRASTCCPAKRMPLDLQPMLSRELHYAPSFQQSRSCALQLDDHPLTVPVFCFSPGVTGTPRDFHVRLGRDEPYQVKPCRRGDFWFWRVECHM